MFTDGTAPPPRRCCSGRLTAFAGPDVSAEEVLRWGWLATAAAVELWDFDTCLAVADARGRSSPATSGALEVLAVGVNVLGQAAALAGDFAGAALLVAEADAVTEATGTRVAPYGALVLGRLPRPRGRGIAADRGHDRGGHRRRPGHRRPVRALGQRRSCINGLGRYDEALAAAATGERRHAGAVRRRCGR